MEMFASEFPLFWLLCATVNAGVEADAFHAQWREGAFAIPPAHEFPSWSPSSFLLTQFNGLLMIGGFI